MERKTPDPGFDAEEARRAVAAGGESIAAFMFQCASRDMPPLELQDALGLAVTAVYNQLLKRFLPRSARLRTSDLHACSGIALDGVISAVPLSPVLAGIVPLKPVSRECFEERVCQWSKEWTQRLSESIAADLHGEGASLTTREQRLVQVWSGLGTSEAVVSPQDLVAAIREGLSLYRKEYGEDLSQAEGDVPATIAHLILTAERPETLLKLLFVGRDGLVRIGSRQVRDQAGPRARGRVREQSDLEPLALVRPDPSPGPSAVVEMKETVRNALAAIRAARAARLARVKSGSAREYILRNLEQLLKGELTLTELSKQCGLGVPALSKALESERSILIRNHWRGSRQ